MTMLNRLKHNELYVLIGLALIGIGVALWCDNWYFFYPPQWQTYMNDNGLDALGVAIGIGLIIYSMIDEHNNQVAGFLLGAAAFFVASLVVLEVIHVILAHQFRMTNTVIGNLFLLSVIMYVARHRDTNHK